MKIFTKILVAVGLLSALTASAQFDQFAEPRVIVLTSPQQISATRTNDVIDIHGFEGKGIVLLTISTNSQNQPNTNQLVTSPDRTNWTALANFAIAVPTAKVYTNLYYGGATPLATNTLLLPGTNTTPTANTAGFASGYLIPAPYTNSGTFVMTNYAMIGFSVPDNARYLGINWIIGNQTNSVGAIFIGRKQQE